MLRSCEKTGLYRVPELLMSAQRLFSFDEDDEIKGLSKEDQGDLLRLVAGLAFLRTVKTFPAMTFG